MGRVDLTIREDRVVSHLDARLGREIRGSGVTCITEGACLNSEECNMYPSVCVPCT